MFFPIYWVVYTQMLNNFICQAAEMNLHGSKFGLSGNLRPTSTSDCFWDEIETGC